MNRSSIDQDDSEEDSEPSPLGTPAELIGFFSRAPKRHRRLSLIVFLTGMIGGSLSAYLIPRVFESSCKVLVQKSGVTQTLSNPRGNVQVEDARDAIQSAPTIILSRENLLALIESLGLIARWDSARPPHLALKDSVMGLINGPLADDEKRSALVSILERKIFVVPDEGSTLRIRVEWQDAQTSFALVKAVEERFLQAKSKAETAVTSEAIAILEDESKRAAEGINVALADVLKAREKFAPKSVPASAVALPATPTMRAPIPRAAPAPTENVTALIVQKRAAIREVRDPWQRQLADLKAQMTALRATYAEAHPLVVALQTQINSASLRPPELIALEEDEKKLLAALAAQPLPAPAPVAQSPDPAPRPAVPAPPPPMSPLNQLTWDGARLGMAEPPEVAAKRERLVAATTKYSDVVDRLDSARVQLEAVQAAFKYRFILVQPPELPRKALRPNRPLLIFGGILGGLILGLLAGGIKDLLGRRFVEAWQVPRRLKLPLLAEVEIGEDSQNS